MGPPVIELNRISYEIIGSAFHIHAHYGPGLFESVYEVALATDLGRKGLLVRSQQDIQVRFDGRRLKKAFRADLLVEDQVLVEVKSVPTLSPVHPKQTLTYTRLVGYRLGLLLNFGEHSLKIKRFINGY